MNASANGALFHKYYNEAYEIIERIVATIINSQPIEQRQEDESLEYMKWTLSLHSHLKYLQYPQCLRILPLMGLTVLQPNHLTNLRI